MVGFAPSSEGGQLPPGVQRLPGPRILVAARYDHSPVGPYLEFVVATPARVGARPGMCVETMVVTTAEARVGGRSNWGFPKELGTLSWSSEGTERVLRWEEREISLRGTPAGPPLPVLVPLWAVQRRFDGLVSVGGRLRGLARLASVEISVPADDALVAVAGHHRGAVVSSVHLVMSKARLHEKAPVAERSPRGAAEPALSLPHRGD